MTAYFFSAENSQSSSPQNSQSGAPQDQHPESPQSPESNQPDPTCTTTWRTWLIGLLGLSIIVILHEAGHFAACKLFNVEAPVFSIGFGPRLAAITIKNTSFQLAALPLGGYVSIEPTSFNAQPFWVRFFIMIAGIIGNFLCTFFIFLYLMYVSKSRPEYEILPEEDFEITPKNRYSRLKLLQKISGMLFVQESGGRSIMGPIGIIKLTGKSLAYGADLFLFTLGILSANIGFFNLLPIPGLDGSKILVLMLERASGFTTGNPAFEQAGYFILLLLFLLFILYTVLRNRAQRS
jgi:membrane-associated protease RseP (regulator of RpoE activity)